MVRLASETIDTELAPTDSMALPSVPVMTGTHFHAVDEKGRVIIPAKLRPALTAQFWMMLDENDNIGIYNYNTGLDVLEHCERMMAEDPDNEDIAAAVERITGAADLVTVENGYRVMISELLRLYASLEREVVTVGFLNHAILWDRAKWEEAQVHRLQSPEIRKVQASMLRAAASKVKRKEQPVQAQEIVVPREEAEPLEERYEIAATGTGGSSGRGVRDAGVAGNGDERIARAPAASTGDGRRSSRVLTLSNIGRRES